MGIGLLRRSLRLNDCMVLRLYDLCAGDVDNDDNNDDDGG